MRNLIVGALVGLLASTAAALDLKPIGNPTEPSVGFAGSKRAANYTGLLDLRDFENLYWGAPSGNDLVYANFTVYFPDEYRYVIAMERFAGHLKSVQCTENMVLEFNDPAAYNSAKSSWDWVNGDVNNTIIMITDDASCSNETERQPFIVSNIAYQDTSNKVLFTSKQAEWEDVAETFDLNVGRTPLTPASRMLMARRVYPRSDYTMNLASNFNKNLFSTTVGDWTTSVDAILSTAGKLNVDFSFSKNPLKISEASINISPQGLNAAAQLALTEKGTLGKEYTWQKPGLISVPVEGIKIFKIIDIGPSLDVDVGFTMEKWSATATANFGAKLTIPDSAKLKIDFLNTKNNAFSGWEPTFSAIPLTVSAEVEGDAKAYIRPNVRLEAKLFKWGYQASIGIEAPNVEAKLAGLAATTGVCNSKKTIGVQFDATIGISVDANAGEVNKNPSWTQNIYSHSWPLVSTCYGIGPDNAGSSSVVKPPVGSKTSAKASSKPSQPPVSNKPVTTAKPAATTHAASQAKPSGTASAVKPSGSAPPAGTAKPTHLSSSEAPHAPSSADKPAGTSSVAAAHSVSSAYKAPSGSASAVIPSIHYSGSASAPLPSIHSTGAATAALPSNHPSGAVSSVHASASAGYDSVPAGTAHPSSVSGTGKAPSSSGIAPLTSAGAQYGASSKATVAVPSPSVVKSSASASESYGAPKGPSTISSSSVVKPSVPAGQSYGAGPSESTSAASAGGVQPSASAGASHGASYGQPAPSLVSSGSKISVTVAVSSSAASLLPSSAVLPTGAQPSTSASQAYGAAPSQAASSSIPSANIYPTTSSPAYGAGATPTTTVNVASSSAAAIPGGPGSGSPGQNGTYSSPLVPSNAYTTVSLAGPSTFQTIASKPAQTYDDGTYHWTPPAAAPSATAPSYGYY